MTREQLGEKLYPNAWRPESAKFMNEHVVRCLEAAEDDPHWSSLCSIASVFNVTTDTLLGMPEDPRLISALALIKELKEIAGIGDQARDILARLASILSK